MQKFENFQVPQWNITLKLLIWSIMIEQFVKYHNDNTTMHIEPYFLTLFQHKHVTTSPSSNFKQWNIFVE